MASNDLPAAIPGCTPWRRRNKVAAGTASCVVMQWARYCPSVHCERCQTLRVRDGAPLLEAFAVPRGRTDLLTGGGPEHHR